MKKRNFNKKLSLNKMIISNLSNREKSNIYGGVNTTSPTDGATCVVSGCDLCLPKPPYDTDEMICLTRLSCVTC